MAARSERQLLEYRSSVADPADFDSFWHDTLSEVQQHNIDVSASPVARQLETVDVYDVRFNGYGGQPIAAWLRLPAGRVALPLVTVVEFDGYGRGRGRPEENLLWASAGFAHLEMDTRGQSWSGWPSDTADPVASTPHMPGMLTKGVLTPETYYYRRVYTDAVRAFDALPYLPAVNAELAFALGTSQGGGIALAARALSQRVRGAIIRVPFLSDMPQALADTNEYPYRELADYLAVYRHQEEQVFRTLSYFDGVNFARRAAVPAQFSVALRDSVCPPAAVLGAYNAYAGEKALTVWSYNGHEGGGIDDDLLAISKLNEWGEVRESAAPRVR